ncbi:MAG: TonB-dependent receptor [Candidatus Eisenbacteria bacterium]|nr:TonB-dependent receptor [Candidatus Eisenbacteria bacterium]
MAHAPSKYEVLVSATRRASDPIEVPNGATVVSGAELKRRGARTLADALQDVVGLDTGEGSDNGMRLPNVGMWGLKEFDALLITLDGVPVGGPFNPSLSQIDVNGIERIEIVKGPQGAMYGASGFAGMVQVFSRHEEETKGHVTLGGGSFTDLRADAALERTLSDGVHARLSGFSQRSDGWQDRTGFSIDRGALGLSKSFGGSNVSLDLSGYRDNQAWGTPMPYDLGLPLPGFVVDRNYAVSGARLEHRVFSAVTKLTTTLAEGREIAGSLSYARDHQTSLRSFPMDFPNADTAGSEGVLLEPHETAVFGDAHFLSRFQLSGAHEFTGGAAITWGRTIASGIGFDFDQALADPSTIPGVEDVPVGDHRSFEDRRTFLGVYAHDSWTPTRRFTVAGGGHYDHAHEKLHAFGQEVGGPAVTIDDSKTSGAWSGDLSGLVRLAPAGSSKLEALNAYANWKSSFKPAAPNLTEAESAEILEPERSHSVEGGFKLRAFARQIETGVSLFQMDLSNLVVSNLDALGNPVLMNAGSERFKGAEVDLTLSPGVLPGLTLYADYAHHDARFVEFTFVTPDGQFRDVGGERLELVPQDLIDARVAYRAPLGVSVWGALRYRGDRPLNRRNTFFVEPYEEYDAGANYDFGRGVVGVTGRNLGDSRHLVTESDIGDSQFYVAPPLRVSAEVSVRF